MPNNETYKKTPLATNIRLAIAIIIAVIIWFMPAPQGVTTEAWQLFAIFVATVVGIILEPFPMGAVVGGGNCYGCGRDNLIIKVFVNLLT